MPHKIKHFPGFDNTELESHQEPHIQLKVAPFHAKIASKPNTTNETDGSKGRIEREREGGRERGRGDLLVNVVLEIREDVGVVRIEGDELLDRVGNLLLLLRRRLRLLLHLPSHLCLSARSSRMLACRSPLVPSISFFLDLVRSAP